MKPMARYTILLVIIAPDAQLNQRIKWALWSLIIHYASVICAFCLECLHLNKLISKKSSFKKGPFL